MGLQTPIALSTVRPPQTPIALSTVAAGKTPIALSIVRRNKTQFALSIVDPRITALDRDRERKQISHQDLCTRARLHPSNWYFLRIGQQNPRASTLERLTAALAAAPKPRPNAVAAQYRSIVTLLAILSGEDPEIMLAQDFTAERPTLPGWLKAATIRRQAMYVAAVELQIGNADLGRALHCSRQNIKQARDSIEDARDKDPRLNALLDRVARLVTP